MSNAKTIARNTAFLFLSEVINHILSFVLIILIARYLGDKGLGQYSFAFSFVGICSIIADMGISVFLTREIAKDKGNKENFIRNAMGLKLFLGMINLLFTFVLILLVKKSPEDIPIIGLATIVIFFDMMTLGVYSIFQAHEKMGLIAIANIIERCIAFGIGVTMMVMGYGIISLMTVLVISYGTRFILSTIVASNRIVNVMPRFNIKVWREIFRGSYPFWFALVFVSIYYSVDTVMLTYMKDYAVTGWYNAARKLVDSLTFIPVLIRYATYPAMSRFHHTSKEFLSLLYKKSINYLFILALPIGVGTTLLAQRIILFFYKEQFIESTLVLQILIWAEVFIFLNIMMGFLLNAINKERIFTVTALICLLINVVSNYFFIQRYSLYGAAGTTVVTEIINFGLLYYFTAKNGYRLGLGFIIKPLIAGIIMGAFIITANSLHLIILVPLAIIIYFLTLFMIKGIGTEEIRLLKEALNIKQPSKE